MLNDPPFLPYRSTDYCPHCDAKMDGGDVDD